MNRIVSMVPHGAPWCSMVLNGAPWLLTSLFLPHGLTNGCNRKGYFTYSSILSLLKNELHMMTERITLSQERKIYKRFF